MAALMTVGMVAIRRLDQRYWRVAAKVARERPLGLVGPEVARAAARVAAGGILGLQAFLERPSRLYILGAVVAGVGRRRLRRVVTVVPTPVIPRARPVAQHRPARRVGVVAGIALGARVEPAAQTAVGRALFQRFMVPEVAGHLARQRVIIRVVTALRDTV